MPCRARLADHYAALVATPPRPRAGPHDWRRARRAAARGQRRRRRQRLADVLAAALIAAILLAALPGLGVVAWFALPLLVLGLAWLGIGSLSARRRETKRRRSG